MAEKTESPKVSTVQIVSFCLSNNLDAEMVGKWIWVSFTAKPARALRDAMRQLGFVYSSRRRKWAHNCGNPTQSAFASDPFAKYPRKPIAR